jgi:hypothetical protein
MESTNNDLARYEAALDVYMEYDKYRFDGGKKRFLTFLESRLKSEKLTSTNRDLAKSRPCCERTIDFSKSFNWQWKYCPMCGNNL